MNQIGKETEETEQFVKYDPYTYICKEVADFNYLFGVITHNYPNSLGTFVNNFNSKSVEFNKSQVKLRFGLINEEIKELEQAFKDGNSIEVIDAMCDILYVVAGAKCYFNLSVKPEVAKSIENKAKTDVDKITLEKLDNIKDLSPEVSPILIDIQNKNCILSNLTDLFLNERSIEYHNLFLAHLINYYDKMLDAIVLNVFTLSEKFNINIQYLFDIVHQSNMTKICVSEDEAKETVEWYKQNEQRYMEPSYREIDYNNKKYYVIFDGHTKKILKSIKYIPAKFI